MSFIADYGVRVLTGKKLAADIKGPASLLRRDCFAGLQRYLNRPAGKIMLLNGLRRTGKTYLARQGIVSLPESERKKAVFVRFPRSIDGVPRNSSCALFEDLYDDGYRYFFVDECTSVREFPSWAKEMVDDLADIGCHIVLLGTDSLSMVLAKGDALEGRYNEIRTTRIPFHEWKRLLEFSGNQKLSVREYFYYGGILDFDGVPVETALVPESAYSFRDPESINHYLYSAVALNLQNTIARNMNPTCAFLRPLWEDGRLIEAVMRVAQDQNHELAGRDLAERLRHDDFRDVYKSLRNLDSKARQSVKEKKEDVLREIEDRLCISHGGIRLEKDEREAVKRYLHAIDVFADAEVRVMPSDDPKMQRSGKIYLKEMRTLQTQPGIRSGQMRLACGVVWEIIRDIVSFSEADFLDVSTTMIEGQMLEDIAFDDLRDVVPAGCEIFKLVWSADADEDAEFVIAILDKRDIRDPKVSLFEVKRRERLRGDETKYLKDPRCIAQVAQTFGKVSSRTVIYNGDTERRAVLRVNADEFLSSIGQDPEAAMFPQMSEKWRQECPLEPWMELYASGDKRACI